MSRLRYYNRELPIFSRRDTKVVEAEESDGCANCDWGKSYVRYFEKDAGTLNVTMRLEVIQKAALLVTAGLLRNVLAI